MFGCFGLEKKNFKDHQGYKMRIAHTDKRCR